jgi:hypothetical protein
LARGDIFDGECHFLWSIWYEARKCCSVIKQNFFRKFACPKRASLVRGAFSL